MSALQVFSEEGSALQQICEASRTQTCPGLFSVLLEKEWEFKWVYSENRRNVWHFHSRCIFIIFWNKSRERQPR